MLQSLIQLGMLKHPIRKNIIWQRAGPYKKKYHLAASWSGLCSSSRQSASSCLGATSWVPGYLLGLFIPLSNWFWSEHLSLVFHGFPLFNESWLKMNRNEWTWTNHGKLGSMIQSNLQPWHSFKASSSCHELWGLDSQPPIYRETAKICHTWDQGPAGISRAAVVWT